MRNLLKILVQPSDSKKKIGKYILYATGEIVLVVIGILIAIQFDNYNEKQNKESDFKAALHQIESDLVTDIKEIDLLDWDLSDRDSLLQLIIQGKVDGNMYLQPMGPRIEFIALDKLEDFALRRKGYVATNRLIEFAPSRYNKLLWELEELYGEQFDLVNKKKDQYNNLSVEIDTYLRDHFPWYRIFYDSDSVSIPSEDAIDYFLNDWKYKNQIKQKRLYTYEFHYALTRYRAFALSAYQEIRKQAGESQDSIASNFKKVFGLSEKTLLTCDSSSAKPSQYSTTKRYPYILIRNRKDEKITVTREGRFSWPISLLPGDIKAITVPESTKMTFKSEAGACLGYIIMNLKGETLPGSFISLSDSTSRE